jgi:hypothetical protein
VLSKYISEAINENELFTPGITPTFPNLDESVSAA